MATVRTPNPAFTGTRGGVVFVDGVGETDDPAALAYFGRAGYTIGSAAKPLEKMNKTELTAIAAELGLGTEGTNRELAERIAAARAAG